MCDVGKELVKRVIKEVVKKVVKKAIRRLLRSLRRPDGNPGIIAMAAERSSAGVMPVSICSAESGALSISISFAPSCFFSCSWMIW